MLCCFYCRRALTAQAGQTHAGLIVGGVGNVVAGGIDTAAKYVPFMASLTQIFRSRRELVF